MYVVCCSLIVEKQYFENTSSFCCRNGWDWKQHLVSGLSNPSAFLQDFNDPSAAKLCREGTTRISPATTILVLLALYKARLQSATATSRWTAFSQCWIFLLSKIERLNNAVAIFSFKLGLPGFDVTRNGIALALAIIFSYPLLFLLTGVHIQLVFEMIHCKSSKLEVQIPHIPTGLIHFDFEAILGSMKWYEKKVGGRNQCFCLTNKNK